MKMFKRIAAVLLAGVMVMAVLTACGGSGGSVTPAGDVEKAEVLYMDVYNALLNSNYRNDPTLKAKARAILDDSLNEDGSLKRGKEMTVTLESDSIFASTVVSIMPSDANNSVPNGLTGAQLNQAMAQKDVFLAEVRKQVGDSMDTMKKCTTRMAVGAVKKGDKVYVALGMTIDLTKLL